LRVNLRPRAERLVSLKVRFFAFPEAALRSFVLPPPCRQFVDTGCPLRREIEVISMFIPCFDPSSSRCYSKLSPPPRPCNLPFARRAERKFALLLRRQTRGSVRPPSRFSFGNFIPSRTIPFLFSLFYFGVYSQSIRRDSPQTRRIYPPRSGHGSLWTAA